MEVRNWIRTRLESANELIHSDPADQWMPHPVQVLLSNQRPQPQSVLFPVITVASGTVQVQLGKLWELLKKWCLSTLMIKMTARSQREPLLISEFILFCQSIT